MDLSFPRPTPADDAPLPAAEMTLLVTTLTTHLEASATAQAQAAIEMPGAAAVAEPLLAPTSGAFNPAMAACLIGWRNA